MTAPACLVNGADCISPLLPDEIKQAELKEIVHRRVAKGILPQLPENPAEREQVLVQAMPGVSKHLVGVALSGGGIRSGAFCLGALQALHRLGVMKWVDYLSTVSGGGYAGAWWSSQTLADDHQPEDIARGENGCQPPRLRNFIFSSNYLARTTRFFNRYIMGLVWILTLCASGLVAFGSGMAWFLRQLDQPECRNVLNSLNLQGDLTAAMIPTVVCFTAWFLLWIASYWKYGAASQGRKASVLFVALCLSLLGGIGLILGTGDIGQGVIRSLTGSTAPPEASGTNLGGTFRWLVFSVIGASLMPYLKLPALLKSGMAPRNVWDKLTFYTATSALLVGIPFVVFAVFADENIADWNSLRFTEASIDPEKDPDKLLAEHGLQPADIFLGLTEVQRNTLFELMASRERPRPATLATHWTATEVAALSDHSDFEHVAASLSYDQLLRVHHEVQRRAVTTTRLTLLEAVGRLPASVIEWKKLRSCRAVIALRTSQALADLGPEDTLELRMPVSTRSQSETVTAASRLWPWRLVGPTPDPVPPTGQDSRPGWQKQIESPRTLYLDQQFRNQVRELEQPPAPPIPPSSTTSTKATPTPGSASGGVTEPGFPTGSIPPAATRADDPSGAVRPLPLTGPERELKRDSTIHLMRKLAVNIKRVELRMSQLLAEDKNKPAEISLRAQQVFSGTVLQKDQEHRWWYFQRSLLAFLGLSLVINLNWTSLHGFYMSLISLNWIEKVSGVGREIPMAQLATTRYGGPYHLISGALTMFGPRPEHSGDRHPEPFLFSHLYCGSNRAGYIKTVNFNGRGFSLPDAIAISGAAVSPALDTQLLIRALMFIGNMRLGQWVANPSMRCLLPGEMKQLRFVFPQTPFRWMLERLLPFERRSYVFVSDGGHAENLGIGQLLARRCRLIIAFDAGADGQFEFEDLTHLVRWSRIRHGVLIHPLREDDIQALAPKAAGKDSVDGGTSKRYSRSHFIAARISYPRQSRDDQSSNEERTGLLIYVKSNLTGDEPFDVLRYAAQNSAFPHDATADQFYNPEQFASYVDLGHHVANVVCQSLTGKADQTEDNQRITDCCRESVDPDSGRRLASVAASPLEAVLDQLRQAIQQATLEANPAPAP